MIIMRNLSIVLCLTIFFFLGCNNDDSSSIDCAEIACTQIFISHHVTVKDSSGMPIPLTRFSVIDINSGEDITRDLTDEELEQARSVGAYPLYDDLTDVNRNPINREIVFKGFIDNQIVIQETYSAGTGCCHSSVEGNLDLVLE